MGPPDPNRTTAGRPASAPAPTIRGLRREQAARRAYQLWGLMTLGGVSIFALFVIWHLLRRGRRLRERATPPRPPRPIDLPETPGRPA